MVTLQILVLSFLVRIQVAQLKRLSFRGSFFFVYGGLLHEGSLATTAKQDAHVLMQTEQDILVATTTKYKHLQKMSERCSSRS